MNRQKAQEKLQKEKENLLLIQKEKERILNMRLNSLYLPNGNKLTPNNYYQSNNARLNYSNILTNQVFQQPNPSFQSAQTLSLPKFQLLYHVQPHLQQFQQNKMLIQNLNSTISNDQNYLPTNNSNVQAHSTDTSFIKKHSFYMPSAVIPKNVSFCFILLNKSNKRGINICNF